MNAGALAMIGVFGSKNSFGLTQAILALVSTWILLDRRQTWIMRGVSGVSLVGAFVLLIAGRSLDAAAAVVGALGCSLLAFNITWFPRRWQRVIMYGAMSLIIVMFSALLVFTIEFDLVSEVLKVAGKDTSLSGRTYLWEWADKLIQESPILGTGLQAFWVQGNPYAEELWAHMGIAFRGGFHFHNLWYEVTVELGYVGLGIAVVTVAAITWEAVQWVTRTLNVESCFFLSYVIFTLMRTIVEVDLFGQFSFTWVLMVAGWMCAVKSRNNPTHGLRDLPSQRDM
jgi:exopolysaccharide production protein ExoQ